MKICGVVAEYNPFHNGHAHHLARTRQQLGPETAVVCAMSGNYVQRGDLAVMEKYRRAAAAVQCGADLVVELPLSACLWSASGFAWGGVSLLDALGCVTHLSFGAEQADLALLRRAAALCRAEGDGTLRQALAEGLPYAAAVQQAVQAADPAAGALLSSPNNTLAIEYLCALDALGSGMQPLAIPRAGGAHDSNAPLDGLPSASYLRGLLARGEIDACRALMPAPSFAELARAVAGGEAPVSRQQLDLAMLSHLRRLTPADLARFGAADGLEHRLWDAIRTQTSLSTVCAAAQTRRYPLARIRRTLLRAWLELPQDIPLAGSYVRVLAIGPRGREVLRRMKNTCALPVIIKPAAARRLPAALQPALARDALADDLYALAYPARELRTAGDLFRKTPYLYTTADTIEEGSE